MMNKLKTAGPAGILTLGAGAWVLRDELHWLMRPTIIETVAAGAAIVGGVLWAKGRGKGKDEPQGEVTEARSEAISGQAAAYLAGIRAAGALPQGTPTWESQTVKGRITREV